MESEYLLLVNQIRNNPGAYTKGKIDYSNWLDIPYVWILDHRGLNFIIDMIPFLVPLPLYD